MADLGSAIRARLDGFSSDACLGGCGCEDNRCDVHGFDEMRAALLAVLDVHKPRSAGVPGKPHLMDCSACLDVSPRCVRPSATRATPPRPSRKHSAWRRSVADVTDLRARNAAAALNDLADRLDTMGAALVAASGDSIARLQRAAGRRAFQTAAAMARAAAGGNPTEPCPFVAGGRSCTLDARTHYHLCRSPRQPEPIVVHYGSPQDLEQ